MAAGKASKQTGQRALLRAAARLRRRRVVGDLHVEVHRRELRPASVLLAHHSTYHGRKQTRQPQGQAAQLRPAGSRVEHRVKERRNARRTVVVVRL